MFVVLVKFSPEPHIDLSFPLTPARGVLLLLPPSVSVAVTNLHGFMMKATSFDMRQRLSPEQAAQQPFYKVWLPASSLLVLSSCCCPLCAIHSCFMLSCWPRCSSPQHPHHRNSSGL